MALKERKALSETDKYNYFWWGVKPMLFLLDDEASSSTTDSDEGLDSEDLDEEPKQVKNKKGQLKPENKQKKDDVTTPKPVELSKAQEFVDPMKSNINDLTEKIGWLTLVLGQLNPDKVA
ncbi:hypothetical protein BS47DRAFT_1369355 [Hydnum rufescens UP504]|uniref:Uncharacterized protein n=1 Tax=Hydnum rufescens UP504 TaxID=1448309 RepID=A0A9P6DML6_9AGAM|nr:hypothetical protein BS47DRAFT_1369355 [Hydnum rufescens UP504]